ncbi:MAG: hypothetical protein IJ113_09535 [Eggerthellaceae bacterium]|nr:hypothetical protein [Eggerthellaceae bacterium]
MKKKTRLEKLKEHEKEVLDMMGKANTRAYAALAREYRATLAEIDILEGGEDDDEIASIILRHRKSNTN